jgi:serine/threonine-protein kinase
VSIGTPAYMAPEQIAGDRNVDARADVYALAVVGYEMLSGVRPFTGSSAQAVLAAHMTEPPVPVRRHRPDVPTEVSAALDRALAKDPAARFQTMGEFQRALGSPSGGVTRPQDRRRRLLLAGAIGTVALLLAVA